MCVVKAAETTFVRKIRTFNVDEIDTSLHSYFCARISKNYVGVGIHNNALSLSPFYLNVNHKKLLQAKTLSAKLLSRKRVISLLSF